MTQGPQYKAFLIRFQRHDSTHSWRTTLQDAQTKQTLHFASENEAIRYLLTHLGESPPVTYSEVGFNNSIEQ